MNEAFVEFVAVMTSRGDLTYEREPMIDRLYWFLQRSRLSCADALGEEEEISVRNVVACGMCRSSDMWIDLWVQYISGLCTRAVYQ